jgi:hypothetical protein
MFLGILEIAGALLGESGTFLWFFNNNENIKCNWRAAY